MKGMATCGVCGRDFALMEEEHYIARDAKKTGIIGAFGGDADRLYDAFDCPHCGCQYVAQERKIPVSLDDITVLGYEEDAEEQEDEE